MIKSTSRMDTIPFSGRPCWNRNIINSNLTVISESSADIERIFNPVVDTIIDLANQQVDRVQGTGEIVAVRQPSILFNHSVLLSSGVPITMAVRQFCSWADLVPLNIFGIGFRTHGLGAVQPSYQCFSPWTRKSVWSYTDPTYVFHITFTNNKCKICSQTAVVHINAKSLRKHSLIIRTIDRFVGRCFGAWTVQPYRFVKRGATLEHSRPLRGHRTIRIWNGTPGGAATVLWVRIWFGINKLTLGELKGT
jgi:hypothetical protein